MKKILAALVLAGVAATAWAGSPADHAAKMKEMQAQMSKCMICKHMAAKMDAIGPMSMDIAKLNNGVAIMHDVNDPSKLPIFRAAGAEMHKAGEACMKLTDAEAKTQLCPFCQEIRGAMQKGATMSAGDTKTGDIMVLTSNDPAVQKEIAAAASKCEMMMAEADHKH